MKTIMTILAVAVAGLSVGCAVPVDGVGAGRGSTTGTDTGNTATGAGREDAKGGAAAGAGGGLQGVDANTQYVAEADQAKAQEIAQRMWQVMTSQPCFYMTNSTYNYSFWGNLQYRYSGYETTSGTIRVSSVGKFGPYDMADVEIGSTQYWIGVADDKTLVISFFYEGGLRSNAFIAPGPGGQCV